MSNYDNRGNVSLWKPQSDNPRAPAARGTVVAHRDIKEGEEVEIALWRNDSDNPRAPLMKGKISDKQQQGQQSQPAQSQGPAQNRQPPMGDGMDDDIPW